MVIVSHDREFLDQLCTKIVETEFGVATTYKGNYTAFTNAKTESVARQWAAYEKQQKEIARQVGAGAVTLDTNLYDNHAIFFGKDGCFWSETLAESPAAAVVTVAAVAAATDV